MSEDNEDLLALLNAHGQQFLSSFASPNATSKKRKAAPTATAPSPKRARSESRELDEEWTGFGASVGAGREADSAWSGDEDDESEGEIDSIEGTSDAHGHCSRRVQIIPLR